MDVCAEEFCSVCACHSQACCQAAVLNLRVSAQYLHSRDPGMAKCTIRDSIPVMSCVKALTQHLQLSVPEFRGVTAPAERQVDQG